MLQIFVKNYRTSILGIGNLLCFIVLLAGWWFGKITWTEIGAALTVCNSFFITFIALFTKDGGTTQEEVSHHKTIKDILE